MKKDLLLIAAAATMLTACVNLDTLQGVNESQAPDAIGFTTFTSNQTKAENSSAVKKHSLGKYHTSFKVWSSKTVNETVSTVFTAQKVNATLETAEDLYTAEEAIAHNSGLTGALAASIGLTADQAEAYNAAMGAEKAENDQLTADEANTYNAQLTGAVAEGDIQTEAIYDWTYTPIVFWDNSATKYDFYAAAPANLNWIWDNTDKKLSLDNFEVTGTTIDPSSTVDPKAVFGEKDIMISEDITNYNTYTSTPVNLSFIHLLSRLNIGIRKASPVLDNHIVKLKSIKIFKMKSNGKYDEAAEITNGTLAGGTYDRWQNLTGDAQHYFDDGVGYTTETVVTTSYNYVYQALVIPQLVEYQSIALNGSDAATSAKPYLNISYEIWVKYTADEAAEYNAGLAGALAATTPLTEDQATAYNAEMSTSKSAGDQLTAEEANQYNAKLDGAVTTNSERKLDDYSYTYNLADAFNGNNADQNIAFNEGWMNTLKITINPIAIDFDADVYEWAPTNPVEIEVPNINN